MEIMCALVGSQLHIRSPMLINITGPRELSITDPKVIPIILGFGSKTFKGPVYASMEESVSTTRDKVFHKQRRQVWDSSIKSCEVLKAHEILTLLIILLYF